MPTTDARAFLLQACRDADLFSQLSAITATDPDECADQVVRVAAEAGFEFERQDLAAALNIDATPRELDPNHELDQVVGGIWDDVVRKFGELLEKPLAPLKPIVDVLRR